MAQKRSIVLMSVLCMIGFSPFSYAAQGGVDLKLPSAHMPSVHFEFEAVVEGQDITHDFLIENSGDAPLEVQSVQTD